MVKLKDFARIKNLPLQNEVKHYGRGEGVLKYFEIWSSENVILAILNIKITLNLKENSNKIYRFLFLLLSSPQFCEFSPLSKTPVQMTDGWADG